MTMKLKRGDSVIIISGKERSKTGTIAKVLPAMNRVAVEGLNSYSKHVKPSPKNPRGGKITAYRSIDVSNVMLLDPETKKPTRVTYSSTGTKKIRLSVLTRKPI